MDLPYIIDKTNRNNLTIKASCLKISTIVIIHSDNSDLITFLHNIDIYSLTLLLQYESQAKPSEHKWRSVQEYQDELMCSSAILVSLLHMDIAHYLSGVIP